jgi:ribonuclease HI
MGLWALVKARKDGRQTPHARARTCAGTSVVDRERAGSGWALREGARVGRPIWNRLGRPVIFDDPRSRAHGPSDDTTLRPRSIGNQWATPGQVCAPGSRPLTRNLKCSELGTLVRASCSPPLLPPFPASLLPASLARLLALACVTLLLVAWEVRPRFMHFPQASPLRWAWRNAVYTDGSCVPDPNGGPSALGAAFYDGPSGTIYLDDPAGQGGTNTITRAELGAIDQALAHAGPRTGTLTLFTDSLASLHLIRTASTSPASLWECKHRDRRLPRHPQVNGQRQHTCCGTRIPSLPEVAVPCLPFPSLPFPSLPFPSLPFRRCRTCHLC